MAAAAPDSLSQLLSSSISSDVALSQQDLALSQSVPQPDIPAGQPDMLQQHMSASQQHAPAEPDFTDMPGLVSGEIDGFITGTMKSIFADNNVTVDDIGAILASAIASNTGTSNSYVHIKLY